MENPITIKITILQPVHKVWDYFYNPKHIVKWNFPTSNWHCPKAENDMSVGGKYFARMEANHKELSEKIDALKRQKQGLMQRLFPTPNKIEES